MATQVNIDLETSSLLDLTRVGVHVYAAHPSTRVLCMAYKIDDAPEALWWNHEPFPNDLAEALESGAIAKAWNAAFERNMWPVLTELHGAPEVPLRQWSCTMVRALMQGFPGQLQHAGPVMGLGVCKDDAGHRVMLQLCKPRQRWKRGGKGWAEAKELVDGDEYQPWGDEIVRWWRDEGKSQILGDYNKMDVVVEHAADKFLDPLPAEEQEAWYLDQEINDRGFHVDMDLVKEALALVKPATTAANNKLKELTHGALDAVTKPNDIRAWINAKLGVELDSISKDVLNDLIVTQGESIPQDVKDVIALRLAAAKTSTAKLNSLSRGVGPDNRFRGGLQFAGAASSRRYAGRRAQIQNFPRPPWWAMDAIPWAQGNTADEIEMAFGSALEAISAVLRSCITAGPGKELIFADYNAIEVRVAAWFCGASKLLHAFKNNEDPYRIMAAAVFNIDDWRSISKGGIERFLGKTLILGAQYGTGHKRFRDSCREQGQYISAELAERGIKAYRAENHEMVAGWNDMERASTYAMHNPRQWVPALRGKVHFWYDASLFLRMALPSGGLLTFMHPRLIDDETPWGTPTLKFQHWSWNGMRNRMEWTDMYGAKFVQYATQAASRDLLQYAMTNLEGMGYPIILSVHDEVGAEVDKGTADLPHFSEVMATPPPWAADLPLKVEGWVGHRYRK